jgi:hypothetical protein
MHRRAHIPRHLLAAPLSLRKALGHAVQPPRSAPNLSYVSENYAEGQVRPAPINISNSNVSDFVDFYCLIMRIPVILTSFTFRMPSTPCRKRCIPKASPSCQDFQGRETA